MTGTRDWHSQILAAQENQRRLMAAETEPCPECGACNEEFKRNCVHVNTCPRNRKDHP